LVAAVKISKPLLAPEKLYYCALASVLSIPLVHYSTATGSSYKNTIIPNIIKGHGLWRIIHHLSNFDVDNFSRDAVLDMALKSRCDHIII
jgi:hypothetical protein